jgi:hypothetical protein
MNTSPACVEYWKSPTVWLAAAVAAIICLLGIRAFLDPIAAATGFGLPTPDAGTAFVQVYAARNMVLGAVALWLVVRRMIEPLAILFGAALALPPLDAWVIACRHGIGPELIRHAVILAVLALTAALLWRHARRGAAAP